MRYDDFRDRWQAALRTARLLSALDRPDETINLTTTDRMWRAHVLLSAVTPFHAGATIDFRSAFEMIVVPRIWDDPKRRAREASADARIDGLAKRFRGAADAWTASVGELVRWLRYAPGPLRPSSRRGRREPFPDDGGAGPETTH